MYKQKLYIFLKTLEVENIEELMEKPSPYLVAVALEIRNAAMKSRSERWCETHDGPWGGEGSESCSAVSYTHLTLPTTPYV